MKRLILFILAVAMIITCLIPTTNSAAFAEEAQKSYLQAFEQTNVLEDLKSANLKFENYPANPNAKASLINFVEFGFSTENQEDFGLFVYIYNPQRIKIVTNSNSNKIQIATEYSSDGLPKNYSKFNLEFLNKSEGEYEDLFLKFKISNAKSLYQKATERRYDISGFELFAEGARTATDYTVGGTWKFKGFAKGFGKGAEENSTLTVSVNELETVSLDVHSTFYRPDNVSAEGKNHQNTINSVYFAVDNSILEEYGKLQKIKAEWYEYKTKPIVITNEYFEPLKSVIGKNSSEYILVADQYNARISHKDVHDSVFVAGAKWAYNVEYGEKKGGVGDIGGIQFFPENCDKKLYYLFNSGNVAPADYILSGEELENYIYGYNTSYEKGALRLKDEKISADLFENSADNGRLKGYNVHEIDSDDTFDMLSYDSNHSWFTKLLEFGFFAPKTDGDLKDIAPIYKVSTSDVSQLDKTVSKSLLINENDVSSFKNFYYSETAKNKSVFLFRFAATDYYAAECFGYKIENNQNLTELGVIGTMAQQTVFLDFDIIQLTFNREGTYTVLPVVANPIDIINDITPPLKAINWLAIIITIIIIVLLIILLWNPVVKPCLKFLWKLISLPFQKRE